jgi:hypothetical protein
VSGVRIKDKGLRHKKIGNRKEEIGKRMEWGTGDQGSIILTSESPGAIMHG